MPTEYATETTLVNGNFSDYSAKSTKGNVALLSVLNFTFEKKIKWQI